MVVVPALSTTTPDSLVPALAGRDVLDAAEQLRAWHASGSAIAASCVGTFVLANAGLLDDGEATTTWWLGPLFRQRYPSMHSWRRHARSPSWRLFPLAEHPISLHAC